MNVLASNASETECRICLINGIWAHRAVDLEQLIKGVLWADNIKPNPLWTFNDLRKIVKRQIKLINDVPTKVNEPEVLQGVLAIIHYFEDSASAAEILKYYSFQGPGSYQFMTASLEEPNPTDFTTVDGQYLPHHLTEDYQAIVAEVRQKIGQTLTLASGYRSRAYQVYLLCAGSYMRKQHGIEPLLKREFEVIAPVGCSHHNLADNPAMDIKEFIPANTRDPEACAAIRASELHRTFVAAALERNIHENFPLGSPINNRIGEPWEFQKRLAGA